MGILRRSLCLAGQAGGTEGRAFKGSHGARGRGPEWAGSDRRAERGAPRIGSFTASRRGKAQRALCFLSMVFRVSRPGACGWRWKSGVLHQRLVPYLGYGRFTFSRNCHAAPWQRGAFVLAAPLQLQHVNTGKRKSKSSRPGHQRGISPDVPACSESQTES